MSVLALIIIILGVALLAWWVSKAPFLEPYRPIVMWALLGIVVIVILQAFGVWAYLKTLVI